jgi:hypothetical protein
MNIIEDDDTAEDTVASSRNYWIFCEEWVNLLHDLKSTITYSTKDTTTEQSKYKRLVKTLLFEYLLVLEAAEKEHKGIHKHMWKHVLSTKKDPFNLHRFLRDGCQVMLDEFPDMIHSKEIIIHFGITPTRQLHYVLDRFF